MYQLCVHLPSRGETYICDPCVKRLGREKKTSTVACGNLTCLNISKIKSNDLRPVLNGWAEMAIDGVQLRRGSTHVCIRCRDLVRCHLQSITPQRQQPTIDQQSFSLPSAPTSSTHPPQPTALSSDNATMTANDPIQPRRCTPLAFC